MKYFTPQWLDAESWEEHQAPIDAYKAYVASIRDQLPPDMTKLTDQELHDAKVRLCQIGIPDQTVLLELDGWKDPWTPEDGFTPRKMQLRYAGVISFTSQNGDELTTGPVSAGDVLYQEIESLGDGIFEHRLLFGTTGSECVLRFRTFRFTYTDGTEADAQPGDEPNGASPRRLS